MFQNYPDVVNIDQIMKMLGLSKSMVYNLLQENRIKHVRVGKRYIVPKTAVAGFLDATWYNEEDRINDGELSMKGEDG